MPLEWRPSQSSRRRDDVERGWGQRGGLPERAGSSLKIPDVGAGMPRPLDQAYFRAREAFLGFDGVVGVGYGPKITRGKVVARQAIIVFVESKLHAEEIPEGQAIPPFFAGLPTDVRLPRLTPDRSADVDEGEPSARDDLCLTDYQWIDWPLIHRRRKGKVDTPREDLPPR
jgi:hypothetical protein